MVNDFEEKQKLLYKNKKNIKKSDIERNEELKQFYQKYKEKQKEIKEKCNKKTIEMKKSWRSNSLILQKYKSPLRVMKEIEEEEKKKLKDEEEKENRKKELVRNKNNMKIPLPKISIKLRKENLKQNFCLNDLQGKERVKHIKEEVDHIKGLLKRCYDLENKRYKQSNIINKHKFDIKTTNRIKSKTINKSANKKKEINFINYLENCKRHSNKKISWDKYLYEEENKVTNINNIKGQIEGLDYNASLKKDIIRINGGFFNNQKLGNELSNLLINSINGKFSVIKAMNNSI